MLMPTTGPASVTLTSTTFVNNSLIFPRAAAASLTSEDGSQQTSDSVGLFYSANAALIRLGGGQAVGDVNVSIQGCTFSGNALSAASNAVDTAVGQVL